MIGLYLFSLYLVLYLFLHLFRVVFLHLFLYLFNHDGSLTYNAVDYGSDVAGKPIFHVQVAEGNPQIEVKYTEAYP
jgi:hypothetical protein